MMLTSTLNHPRGLRLQHDIVSREEERVLIDLIESSGLSHKTYEGANRRSSRSFGWEFDFVNNSFVTCPPVPEGFHRIRATAAMLAGAEADRLVQCLLNRYEPGAGIAPHVDKPVWDIVVGVSLGAGTVMEFRDQTRLDVAPIKIEMPARSAYLLSGDARNRFTHALPPVEATRWSITFRSFAANGDGTAG